MNEKANSSDGKSKIGGGVFNCRYDEYFTLIDADDHLFEFLGYTREEFSERFHNHILDAVYEGDRKMVMGEISRQLKNGSVFMYENRLVKKAVLSAGHGSARRLWRIKKRAAGFTVSSMISAGRRRHSVSLLSVSRGMRSCSHRCRTLSLSWTVSPYRSSEPAGMRGEGRAVYAAGT